MSTAAAPAAPSRGILNRLLDNSDVAIAVVVVGIVVMMVLPLPPFLLDILITANISAALAIVLATLYTTEPLQFSVFPSLLLVATLFRLGLNISSTRLILLDGDAGEVIGIDHFGASAAYTVLYEEFGLTKEAVVAAARESLAAAGAGAGPAAGTDTIGALSSATGDR